MIRAITLQDAERICDIYNYYIEHSTSTFECEPVLVSEMQARIKNITQHYPWLVYEHQQQIHGYAYASLWKSREAYRHIAETTVYTAHNTSVKGMGTALYEALITALQQPKQSPKIKALIGVITVPNDASIGLHKKFGFSEAGYFTEVGNKFDQWIDVAYYQKKLF